MLELIVFAAGHFVKMDGSTSMMAKGRYAHITIEVDIGRPLTPGTDVILEGVDVPIFWQCFEYEHVHLYALDVAILAIISSIVRLPHQIRLPLGPQLTLIRLLSRRRMWMWCLQTPSLRLMMISQLPQRGFTFGGVARPLDSRRNLLCNLVLIDVLLSTSLVKLLHVLCHVVLSCP